MHPLHSPQWRRIAAILSVGFGTISAFMLGYGLLQSDSTWQARAIPGYQRGEVPWVTITAEQVIAGRSVPPNSHVIFSLPPTMKRITRYTLFGERGETVRYWGYCFPTDPVTAAQNRRTGLPGVIFMSEMERRVSDERYREIKDQRLGLFDNLDGVSIENQNRTVGSIIRHQKDTFYGGETCYIMTQQPLPIGLDEDEDRLNSRDERDRGTNPSIADTDEDGVIDGYEVFRAKTNPLHADSDGDGLIDGIEDKNRNGRVDEGETSPSLWDTDRDGLCDGFCIINNSNRGTISGSNGYQIVDQQDVVGEDKNLNGKVDPGETDPLKIDTDGDGITDEQEYYSCLLSGQVDC